MAGSSDAATAWFFDHVAGLLTTLAIAYTFFLRFVRPAVGEPFPDALTFVNVAAFAHTGCVACGIYVGESSRGVIPAVVGTFIGWILQLWVLFTLQLGPFYRWSMLYSLDGGVRASIVCATSLTLWFAAAASAARREIGKALVRGPFSLWHLLISVGSLLLLLLDPPPIVVLAVMLCGYTIARVADPA